MYFGSRHTATRTLTDKRVFRCVRCGFQNDAVVTGVGSGEGRSPFLLDESGAETRASESAHYAAGRNIELTLRLCPCPRCGARDDAGFWMFSIAMTILVLAGVWGVGWLFTALERSPDFGLAAWIFGPLGVAAAVAFYFLAVHWKWTTAAGRVRFLGAAGEVARRRAMRSR